MKNIAVTVPDDAHRLDRDNSTMRLVDADVLDSTPDLLLAAAATCRRFGVSTWDVAILEAARLLRCDLVLSEDLSDGQGDAGVRVENHFRTH
jgi:predicted nucleic acid-binding protein